MVPLPEAAGPSMAMTKGFMRAYQAEERLKGKGIAAFRLLRIPARCPSPETSEAPRCARYLKRPSARIDPSVLGFGSNHEEMADVSRNRPVCSSSRSFSRQGPQRVPCEGRAFRGRDAARHRHAPGNQHEFERCRLLRR